MSFAENLKHILSKLEISDKDRVEYTKDAVEIQNFVVQQLQENDETFRRVFAGFSLGGDYLDRVKLVTPDEFDLHMKLKFPYEITPKRDEKGFVFLYAPNGYAPGVATDNYIHRDFLQNWLRGAFERVFSSSVRFRAIYGVYTLKYTLAGYACAHTIEAVCGNREIFFDLVPAFEFDSSLLPREYQTSGLYNHHYPWFAVPQKKSGSNDERTFMVCAPHWEREMMKNSYNFKNVLRLMKGLKDKAGRDSLPHLTSYMLKTVMLHKHNSVNWQRDEGSLLVEMWRSLINHLGSGRLDFILAENHNIFDRMTYNERSTCVANAQGILNKLC
ncbi:hypothetical protein KR059_008390, partial [Drosophila kikkawai]